MPAENTKHDVSLFWTIADEFKNADSTWIPAAKFELRERVNIHGDWVVCLSIMVIGETSAEGRPYVRFESNVTLWPPKLTELEEMELARLGWYEGSLQHLLDRGYCGSWERGPVGADSVGRWGTFTRSLADVASVRTEAGWFERVVKRWKSGYRMGDWWILE